ncbi:MAG: glucosaminidase domain-containing protein [Macrococcus canis]|uniref:N-acetylmuramoyl-L-alanine amidase n=1 Tax=Macrococcoides canis TaxID=1855823 RepID=UPI002E79F9E4|nr:GW dipeptide domain-containing protein [Macrococcus canis]MEE1108207.1 glucosaminidase domain-containing protein [Macrococcus canis]
MDNKFYYKTPAALLMMLAGGTTVAHAAEQAQVTPEKTQTDAVSATTAKTAATTDSTTTPQRPTAQATPVKTQTATVDVKSQYSLSQASKTATATTAQTTDATATSTASTTAPKTATTATSSTEKARAVQVDTTTTTEQQPATDAKVNTSVASATAASTTEKPAVKTATPAAEKSVTAAQTVAKTAAESTTNTVTATNTAAPATTASQTKSVVTAPATKPATEATKSNVQTAAISLRGSIDESKVRTLTAKSPANMSVNEYIKYNNYQVPQYETRYFEGAPQIAYRNGVAKPEGIVAHETANPNSTIEGEISYMSRNINNAFVHAFVDDNNIIETANTDYLSWGAGGVSNPRNINVELVRVYGKDRFSKSVNNLADYLATNLMYYNLPVDNAHNDGQGTVWSHQAVSNYLGGTDHTDPVGWFAENNYTFDEFYSLVQEKYNYKLNGTKPTPPVTVQPTPPKPAETVKGTVTTSSAQMMARVNSTTAKVYSSVDSATGVNAGQKAGNTYYVNKKATLNGNTYYALTDETKTPRGWVKANDTTAVSRSAETAVTGNFNVNAQATNLYKTPWGTANQVVTNLKAHVGKKFTPAKKVTVGTTNYYFGTVNNLTGWINFNELTLNVPKPVVKPAPVAPQPIKVSSAQMVAKVKLPTSKIYTSVDQKTGVNALDKANRTYYVNKKATYNGSTYYALSDEANNPRGWVKASDAIASNRSAEVKVSGKYKVNSKATSLYSMPDGTMKQVVKQLKPFIGKSFTPSKKVTVNQSVYVYGTLNNIAGWLKQHEISVDRTPVITKSKAVKLIGRTAPKQVLIYKDLKTIKPVTKLIDTQVYVNETAKRNNVPYYKVADNNNKVLGWISSKFIKTAPTATVSWTKSAHTVKAPTGYIYNIPSGADKQRIDKLSAVKGGTLQVIRTDKVGRTLWHKVIYNNNKIGYVSARDLFTQKITKQKAPTTLAAAVSKQMNLGKIHAGSAPKVVFSTPQSAYNVRNATAAEVTKAMNTKDKLTDPVMKYQFLDLGKSEGISAKTLNKLLVGKGALAGQGAAFAKAAQQFNINEVYLIAHAILETGHGSSRLANGLSINSTNTALTSKGKKYFNMYGAKADDNNPEIGGIKYAKAQGWDNQSKAIIGGAKYVRSAYIDHGQRTLHQMRWNPANPATHQYATDINWAAKNAAIIAGMYKTLGLDAVNYVIHEY